MPGSRDLIQYDFIGEQPDILVETLQYVEGEVLEYTSDPPEATQYLDTPGVLEWHGEDSVTGVVRSTTEGNGSEVQEYFQSQGAFSYDGRDNDYVEKKLEDAGQIDGGGEHGQARGQVQLHEYDQLGAAVTSDHGDHLFGETQTETLVDEYKVPVEASTELESLATAEETMYDAASFYGLDEGVQEGSRMS